MVGKRAAARERGGGILIEVVLALGLFVAAASAVVGGLHASIDAAERLRAEAVATDLAVSAMSGVQIGLIPALPAGAERFPAPHEEWSWEISVEDVSGFPVGDAGRSSSLRTVEVTVRHAGHGLVERLAQQLYVHQPPRRERPAVDEARVARLRELFRDE